MTKRSIATTAEGVVATIPMSFVEDPAVPIAADFAYRPEEPYAVSVVFRTTEQAVTWNFGRDILSEGVQHATGFGDVQAWPARSRRGVPVVTIQLASPDGVVQVEGSRRDISRFLDAAYRLVPVGEESRHVDFDAELAELLCS
jgi:hypothetical protein